MIDPTTVSMIRDIVAIFGVVAGFSYYFITVQNTNKARKIQLLREINEFFVAEHSNLPFYQMMNMKWDDYEDFNNKYGINADLEFFDERTRLWRNTNYTGLLMKDGLIDISTYVQYIGDNTPIVWNKFKPIVMEMRKIYDNPELYIGWETLAAEVDKYRISKGLKPKNKEQLPLSTQDSNTQ